MIPEPLVTIGAANYNNSRFVVETLESIRSQSYQNIELVIVDDCSTDDSVSIIEEWLLTYEKPHKFITHDRNMGVCRTTNDLLQNANGKYISTIATDDIMLPEKISNQVEILESSSNDVCAVYSDAYMILENSAPRYGLFIQRHRDFEQLPSGNIFNALLSGNFLPAMSLLVKMSHYKEVGHFDEELVYEDYDMWLRLSKRYEFIVSDYISVKYRVRPGSLVTSIKNWSPSQTRIWLKHLDSEKVISFLEETAKYAYITKDTETLRTLQEAKLNNNYINKLLLFHKLNIPPKIGYRILDKIIN